MSSPRPRTLSKSRFCHGLQCLKQLWWRVHDADAPELTATAALQATFDRGHLVGQRARAEFPGGTLIDRQQADSAGKIGDTRAALEAGATAIFEASFSADGVFAAVDVLQRRPRGFGLIEVKSTVETKEQHLPDVAIQLHVLRQAGLEVSGAEVMHLNRDCRFPDLSDLFVRDDVTAEAEAFLPAIPGHLERMRAALAGPLPEVAIGPHCDDPYPCPFKGRCWPALADDHVSHLYYANRVAPALLAGGIELIRDIPAGTPLSEVQARQVRAVRSRTVVVEGPLGRSLAALVPPVAYLDFETIAPAIPVWPGCGPYMAVPVQMSCHLVGAPGTTPRHHQHLAEGPGDPRPALAAAVVRAGAGARSVVAYNAPFERRCLEHLAEAVPSQRQALLELAGKLVDLLPMVRNHVYHPGFGGSFSMKVVAPALVPGIDYAELTIGEGGTASNVLEALLLGDGIDADDLGTVRAHLLEYCALDTLAMVKIVERLRQLAGVDRTPGYTGGMPLPAGTLHPADAPRPTSSEAEKAVWAGLKTGLPAGWTAWHSLRIRDDKNLLGETDFVLAHPERGLLVLEVKGGQVEQRDGRWFSNQVPLRHSPLDQALRFLGRLNKRLDQWNCQAPAWGAAVAFPDRDVDQQPTQDDLRGVVLGRNHLARLDQWLPAVVERALPLPRPARGEWMKRLHQLWGETWSKPLALGTRVELAKQRTLALDERQLDALDLLASQERALIQGGAGTGKTLLAVEAARRLAGAGQRVLLLCSTQPLAKWLGARLEGAGIQVETVSGLARALAEQADGPRRSGAALVEADWTALFERASELAEPCWDAVIIDEAQDFPFEAWAVVEGLARGRRLWAFQDPGQRYWTDRVVPADLFGPPFTLKRGQRSPSGIEALAERYAGGPGDDQAIVRAVTSRELVLVDCPRPEQAADRVGVEVERLWSEGIKLADIGVVSLHGQTRSDAVHRARRLGRHEFVLADADGMEERLVADSFLRWKGLERPVIIIADVDPSLNQFAIRMHIALTRALAAVRIIAPRGQGAWPGLPG